MNRCIVAIFALLSISLCVLDASTNDVPISEAVASLQSDIQRDTVALVAIRERITTARDSLSQELRDLETEAARLRGETERMQRVRREGEQAQTRIREKAAAARESLRYAESLLIEYARAVETRLPAAEASRGSANWRVLRDRLEQGDVTGFSAIVQEMLALTEQQNLARVGGQVLEGMALDGAGVAHEGRFAILGPLAWFVANRNPLVGGQVVARLGSVEPGIYPFAEDDLAALRRIMDGQGANVPVDVTGGDAIRVEEARMTIVARLRAGGMIMIPLLLTGGVALLLAASKSMDLLFLHRVVKKDVSGVVALLRQGTNGQVRDMVAAFKNPLRDIVEEALVHREAPRAHLEEILHEHVVNVLPRVERHLGALAVLGGVAPLLGLLGTVTGMIHTFQLVTLFGSGDARMLSGGISEALVTTETGLVIAVPVLLLQAFLARSARSVVATLERQALRLVNELHARGNLA